MRSRKPRAFPSRTKFGGVARQMKQTGEPIVLTVNGKAEVVIQDAKSYQQLLEKIEKLETIAGIKQGLADIELGQTRLTTEFTAEMQQKYGISS